MNKAILMGRLTRDPEVRYSQSANPVAVARYGLAVRRSFVKPGEPGFTKLLLTASPYLATATGLADCE